MSVVWKYELQVVDYQTVFMPAGAEVLTVQTQQGAPCLWARVDPDAADVGRRFRMAGTGHQGAEGDYVGTFQLHDGALVFHVFEVSA